LLFNSVIFCVFMMVLLPLYWGIRHSTARKWLLLFASYAFYAHWDYRYLSLLLLSTAVDFLAGRRLARVQGRALRRFWLLASLITNLGVLAVFKYGNFLIASAAPLWAWLGVTPLHFPDTIPVGISFYTFQTLSYTIDVYRGRTSECRSLLDFALFVSFFAQLVAGPIVRSTEFLPQLKRMTNLRAASVVSGAQLFMVGLFKKVILADNVGLYVDEVFGQPGNYSAPVLWCGACGFALQIYCDFSGYSDMAIGIGRAFGLQLPENFRAPYLARSITEFWRRWHISLSRWLRDYLYIPLGGNRRGPRRTYANLMLTMLLGGLWHGASWTFVAWGGFHGALLALERLMGWGTDAADRGLRRPTDWLRAVITFMLICISWVMFRADGFPQMFLYLKRMFTAWDYQSPAEAQGLFWVVTMVFLVGGQYLHHGFQIRRRVWDPLPAPLQGLALATLVILLFWYRVDEIAFIYFQF